MGDRRQRPEQERRWFVRQGDHVDGPHPESRVRAWLRDGHLPGDVLLSTDCRTWRPVKAPRKRPPAAAAEAPAPPAERPRPETPSSRTKLPPPVLAPSDLRRRRRRLRRWVAVVLVVLVALLILFVLDLG